MCFSGRSHGLYQIQGNEFISISICKQYLAINFDTLTHWNLGFTTVTSALEYVCQTREYFSTIAKCVVSATVFVSIIAYQ